MDDLAKHPQNRFVEVGSPTGPVRMLAPGVVVNGGVPDLGDVPSLGQHTDEVRAEFAEACLASA
jgi:crotonobetainyl-CoA:carnitine CoA-transferase CaiB-like acyl-CoA transferase